jgi:hypothetical protein
MTARENPGERRLADVTAANPPPATGKVPSARIPLGTAEITVFRRSDGRAMSKRISLQDGRVAANGSECRFSAGTARRVRVTSVKELAELISNCPADEALALGSVIATAVETENGNFDVVTSRLLRGLERPPSSMIARTKAFLEYGPVPGFLLIDFDLKGAPNHVTARIQEAGGFWPLLCRVWPALDGAAHVFRPSTSSGLYNTESGEEYPGAGGGHYYVQVMDVGDSARALVQCLSAYGSKGWAGSCWAALDRNSSAA